MVFTNSIRFLTITTQEVKQADNHVSEEMKHGEAVISLSLTELKMAEDP